MWRARAMAVLTPSRSVVATSSMGRPSNGAFTVIVGAGACVVVMGQRYPPTRLTSLCGGLLGPSVTSWSRVELVEPRAEANDGTIARGQERARHVALVAPDLDVFLPTRARVLVGP